MADAKILERIYPLFYEFQVAKVAEDVGTAGALRAIAPHLYASDILVRNCNCTKFPTFICPDPFYVL